MRRVDHRACIGRGVIDRSHAAGLDVHPAGTLVATNGGQPLSATVDVNGTAAKVVAGAFSATLPVLATGSLPVMIVGEVLVTRRVYLAGGMSRSVALDAIDRSAGFDLEFYRELVRNAYEAPTTLQSLRRWTRNPQIYMRTVDDAGAPIDAVTAGFDGRAVMLLYRKADHLRVGWSEM